MKTERNRRHNEKQRKKAQKLKERESKEKVCKNGERKKEVKVNRGE